MQDLPGLPKVCAERGILQPGHLLIRPITKYKVRITLPSTCANYQSGDRTETRSQRAREAIKAFDHVPAQRSTHDCNGMFCTCSFRT